MKEIKRGYNPPPNGPKPTPPPAPPPAPVKTIGKIILENNKELPNDRAFVSDALKPSLSLLCKLGSVVVHLEEAMSAKGHKFDVVAMKSALYDTEIQQWIKDMGVYMPVKR